MCHLSREQRGFLADLSGRETLSSEARAAIFAQPPAGTVEDRWHIYTSGYFVRLHEVLIDDYRAIHRIVGADSFTALVARFLMACPPCDFDLAKAGERLPEFLKTDSLTAELPFLPDLARLERAVTEVFVAADANPTDWAALRSRDPEQVAEARLGLQPAAVLIRSVWPLRTLWRLAFEPEQDSIDVELNETPRSFLISRYDGAVYVREIAEEIAELLQLLAERPRSIGELAGDLGLGDEAEDVHHFIGLLQRALATNVICHSSAPEETGGAFFKEVS